MEPASPNWVVFYLVSVDFKETFGPLSIVADHVQQAVLRTLLTYLLSPASLHAEEFGSAENERRFQFYDLISEETMRRSKFGTLETGCAKKTLVFRW